MSPHHSFDYSESDSNSPKNVWDVRPISSPYVMYHMILTIIFGPLTCKGIWNTVFRCNLSWESSKMINFWHEILTMLYKKCPFYGNLIKIIKIKLSFSVIRSLYSNQIMKWCLFTSIWLGFCPCLRFRVWSSDVIFLPVTILWNESFLWVMQIQPMHSF